MIPLAVIIAAAASFGLAYAATDDECFTHDCLFYYGEKTAAFFVERDVTARPYGGDVSVRIDCTLPTGVRGTAVNMTVAAPDGTVTEQVLVPTDSGTCSGFHIVEVASSFEDPGVLTGTYVITGTYVTCTGNRDEDTCSTADMDPSEFVVRLDGGSDIQHTVTVAAGAESHECHADSECFVGGDTRWDISQGDTVRFASDSVGVHHLHAVAAGIPDDYAIQTRIPKGAEPNMFDAGILERGGFSDITFPVPGSVLFTCQYHPWMQGLITVRPQEGDGPPADLPESVPEIVQDTRPAGQDDGDPPPASATKQLDVLTDRTEYSNGGDPVSVTVTQSPDRLRKVTVQISGGSGTVYRGTVTPSEDGTAHLTVTAVPSWESGTYTVRADKSRGSSWHVWDTAKFNVTRDARCDASCVAGTVSSVNGSAVRVSGSESEIGTSVVSGDLSEICPVGGRVLAYPDPDIRGSGIIWCGDGDASANELLIAGGAAADAKDCRSTGFGDRQWVADACSRVREDLPAEVAGEIAGQIGGDCPIALASYGTHLAPHVQHLRELRDGIVSGGGAASAAIHAAHAAYYSVSPYAADALRESPAALEAFRAAVTPAILAASGAYHAVS